MKKPIAIISMKCPRCREEDLFTNRSPFPLSQMHRMPDYCSVCGLKFNPEPGFYTGAMYVSYGLSVSLFIVTFFTLYIGLQIEVLHFLLIYGTMLLVLSPFLFRYSRTLYIHMFYSYEPKAKQDYFNSLRIDTL